MQEEKCPPKFPESTVFGAPKGLLRRCQTGFIHTDPHKVFFKTRGVREMSDSDEPTNVMEVMSQGDAPVA